VIKFIVIEQLVAYCIPRFPQKGQRNPIEFRVDDS
jgi:hypothetical protein